MELFSYRWGTWAWPQYNQTGTAWWGAPFGMQEGPISQSSGNQSFRCLQSTALTASTAGYEPAAFPVVPSATSRSGWEPSSAGVHLKISFSAFDIVSSKSAASTRAALMPAETAPRSNASFWDGILSPQTAHTASIIASMGQTGAVSYILPVDHLCHNNPPQNTSEHTSGRLQPCSR